MSDIRTVMRSANPIPDAEAEFGPEDLDALLTLTRARSGDMDTKKAPAPVRSPEPRKWNGWLVAAAAFAVVIVVVGATMLFSDTPSSEPPATTPTTQAPPTTVAESAPPTTPEPAPTSTTAAPPDDDALSPEQEAFVGQFFEAFNARDEAGLLALVAPDARFTSYAINESAPERWARELQWRWALGENWTAQSCALSFSVIACDVSITGGVFAFLDSQEATLRITVVDDALTSMNLQEDLAELLPALAELQAWLQAEHPDKVSTMNASADAPSPPSLTDESIALWQEVIPEYLALRAEGGG